ncbi:D-aminoacyl-tRNA deacylase [Phascolarctobacterium faecium]|uniref:D-aminoacyl-tRNA deacylase n=1 Tax=Phascolarctobacterium faecium TaxID=33025 RepID=UPI00210E3903|nr:D-aminoacyl-tRNA deacylase [Phascolarctobacterium faecium]
MRAVVQRVDSAAVEVEGAMVGSVGKGILVLLGVEKEDTDRDLEYLLDKVAGLRIFEDEQEKMNLSIADVGGGLLVVSQFTLYGDCRKGKRPSFDKAAGAEMANAYYEKFVDGARAKGLSVGTGKFQAHMLVSLVNNGPVTILLDSKKNF